MKSTAILVNMARGAIVDQDAFLQHMHAGKLMGAAFDVLWDEPLSPDSPLLTFENIVFTPHVASSSKETAWKALELAFDNLYRVAASKNPLNQA